MTYESSWAFVDSFPTNRREKVGSWEWHSAHNWSFPGLPLMCVRDHPTTVDD